ncbi:MAG: hypothetical protein A2W93_12690 [Bacteroidetes bacterium GWF2_43_63]|nr:MAG: hypothetical protein A2W94_06335 [Bacteroidetes bacterium GWE2_42_42]OFY54640.1 MAG: hypothetical protein A2W93_12690 [Bacteroidetes bacterium GWF2_43_63]HBG71853.1 hypothetical protein [Bacteroidales bacterium]HCB61436.1 hypothetical protein [Bacteroidales bacterium]HCY23329.1 hypothetical protein [Bacteroidales bacterium]
MRLYNNFRTAFLALAALLLTSCIELEERIIIYPDKSGDYSLKLDLSALSQTGMDAFKPSDEILNFPQTVENAVKNVSGISNVKAESDTKKGIYQVSFRFKNHKVFKRALLQLAGMKYGFIVPKYMKAGKHRFSKKNIGPLIAKQINKQDNSPLKQDFMGVDVASMINVKTIIETPHEVKNIKKNVRAVKTNDPEIVEIKSTLKDILNGASTGVVVRY